ncbi:MAG: hypothetical protein ABSE81_01995 [Candidatus Omnitrophota bacterium]
MKPLKIPIILLFTFCFSCLCGCAGLKENVRGFAGISTKVLEDERKDDALKITFKHDYSSCYKNIMDVLTINKCYIYTTDPRKDLIALYVSEDDTTPVGIFLTEIDKGTTLIEVSSPSTYAKETIAKIIFSAFDKKPLVIIQKKGQLDIKKVLKN